MKKKEIHMDQRVEYMGGIRPRIGTVVDIGKNPAGQDSVLVLHDDNRRSEWHLIETVRAAQGAVK